MKEADKDLYQPGGLWVTSYRLLRFFPDGSMWSHLCASQTPTELRKAAMSVTPASPASLERALRSACWGEYRIHEQDGRTNLEARVLLMNAAYPNMSPAEVVYRFELRFSAVGPSNSELYLVDHSVDHNFGGTPA